MPRVRYCECGAAVSARNGIEDTHVCLNRARFQCEFMSLTGKGCPNSAEFRIFYRPGLFTYRDMCKIHVSNCPDRDGPTQLEVTYLDDDS